MSATLTLLRDLDKLYRAMVKSAEALDWDELERSWTSAESNFARLKQSPLATSLEFSERREARELIESLLARQQQINDRVRPWMDQVRPLLDSFDRFPLKPGRS